jgi:ABC-2 type transport system permease protein
MTAILVRKSLRDARTALIVIALLLVGFECLWSKITQRITGQLIPFLGTLQQPGKTLAPVNMQKVLDEVQKRVFEGPGQIIRTLIGGERLNLGRAMDVLSIGYVHPLLQALLCIWAIGRAAGAITGEIDRGTMELLLAQPVPRTTVIRAQLLVDWLTIPALCLSIWGGTLLGVWLVGRIEVPQEDLMKLPPLLRREVTGEQLELDPWACAPGMLSVAALLFAVSGYTLWLSARGRFRGRVLGVAVLLTLLQFLVNVVGQLWPVIEPLRVFTVFYYYQPQEMILRPDWYADGVVWLRLGVLLGVGAVGYLLALRVFCARDLPAPL